MTNIWVDLSASSVALEDGPFNLRCSPEVAADLLQQFAALGYDEAVLVHPDPTERDLAQLRALLPA